MKLSWASTVRQLLHTYEVIDGNRHFIKLTPYQFKDKLEDTSVSKWYEELWNDNQIVGENKLRTY